MKIKYFLLIILCLTAISNGFAKPKMEEVKRLANETTEDFAKRSGPSQTGLAHPVIETEAWGIKKTILAFYNVEVKGNGDETFGEVEGYIFVPKSSDTYEKIFIYHFGQEGDVPKIESVFFANADKDKAPELIVICSWHQRHYDFEGTLYETFVFDNLPSGASPAELKYLEKISDKVSGGCDCLYRDRTKGTKSYETAAQVRAGLRKLGFR